MGVQVDLLTRDKTCHEKEFIDFEFDGKHISEFGMVAVFDGDRHSFDASPSFEDETSEVNGVSGQYYWGTRMKTITKSFSLATDGITEAQINAFKLHFKPGKYGKFIEDKLACRYGWCRVSSTSSFSVVPFVKKTTIKIGDTTHTVEINEYKGSAKLTFIFDDPYFYATNQSISADSLNEEALRESLLNGLPIEGYSWPMGNDSLFIGNTILNNNSSANLNKSSINFYNPSTAPTESKLSLTFMPTFTSSSINNPIYFTEIADNINGAIVQHNTINQYNSGKLISSFYYTSPNIIYQTNRAIQIAANYYLQHSKDAWIVTDLEEALRLDITNPKVIGWATAILRIMKTTELYDSTTGCFNEATRSIDASLIGATSEINANWFVYFNYYMLCIIANYGDIPSSDSGKTLLETTWQTESYTVHFNSELSETTMDYSYNTIVASLGKIEVSEEKCGDMICSPYLKLDGGDSLNDQGYITSTHSLTFLNDRNSQAIPAIELEYTYTYL